MLGLKWCAAECIILKETKREKVKLSEEKRAFDYGCKISTRTKNTILKEMRQSRQKWKVTQAKR